MAATSIVTSTTSDETTVDSSGAELLGDADFIVA